MDKRQWLEDVLADIEKMTDEEIISISEKLGCYEPQAYNYLIPQLDDFYVLKVQGMAVDFGSEECLSLHMMESTAEQCSAFLEAA